MKTVINIKADREVKKSAQRIAEELGFSLSAVVNAYLKQFIRSREIHVSVAPKMSPELEKLLGEVEQDIKNAKDLSPTFSSSKEMDRYLNSL